MAYISHALFAGDWATELQAWPGTGTTITLADLILSTPADDTRNQVYKSRLTIPLSHSGRYLTSIHRPHPPHNNDTERPNKTSHYYPMQTNLLRYSGPPTRRAANSYCRVHNPGVARELGMPIIIVIPFR